MPSAATEVGELITRPRHSRPHGKLNVPAVTEDGESGRALASIGGAEVTGPGEQGRR